MESGPQLPHGPQTWSAVRGGALSCDEPWSWPTHDMKPLHGKMVIKAVYSLSLCVCAVFGGGYAIARDAGGAEHKPATAACELTKAEEWFTKKVAAGEVANLTTSTSQVIRSCFLETLLTTTNHAASPNGVHIINAIVTNKLYVSNEQIR